MPALTSSRTNEIDHQAEALLDDVFGSVDNIELPVNLDSLIDFCGLKLKQGNFKDDNISAALDRDSKTIFISSDEGQSRQSFSIAHELGHYKLHADVKTDVFYRNQATHLLSNGDGQRETEANWFAASLLMPESAVRKFWKVIKEVDNLAKIFGVSPSAMRYRLKHLGLIKT